MKLRNLSLTTLLAATIAATACTLPAASAAEPCRCPHPIEKSPCPRPAEYWKGHLKHTEVTSLRLGQKAYSREELQALLKMHDHGDQSIVLAKEMIAAKLNRMMGADTSAIDQVCAHASSLLNRTGQLPYKAFLPRRAALAMYQDAAALEIFNKGKLTPKCKK